MNITEHSQTLTTPHYSTGAKKKSKVEEEEEEFGSRNWIHPTQSHHPH